MREKRTNLRFWLLVLCLCGTLLILDLPAGATALSGLWPISGALEEVEAVAPSSEVVLVEIGNFGRTLLEVGPVMLLAALLGGLVGYRRRLTVFERDLFQAHILLSVAGAMMMLIVGNQLARAFGLMGAASVVRYRYKLGDPRDASILIIALGVGMASGVGLYALAISAAVVVAAFSQGLDYLVAKPNSIVRVARPTALKIHTTQPEATLARVERLFTERKVSWRLQSYRLLSNEKVNGEPVYQLTCTLRLAADDTRFDLTTQLTNKSVVALNWETKKP